MRKIFASCVSCRGHHNEEAKSSGRNRTPRLNPRPMPVSIDLPWGNEMGQGSMRFCSSPASLEVPIDRAFKELVEFFPADPKEWNTTTWIAVLDKLLNYKYKTAVHTDHIFKYVLKEMENADIGILLRAPIIARWNHREARKLLERDQAILRFLINRDNENSISLLHYAATTGHVATVRFLVKLGLPTDFEDQNRATALHYAAGYNHRDVLEYLCGCPDADVNQPDSAGWTPLHYVCGNPADSDPNKIAKIEILKAYGAHGNSRYRNAPAPIHLATRYCSYGVIQKLIETYSDINLNEVDCDRNNVFHYAVMGARDGKSDRTKVIYGLQKWGATDHSAENNEKETPMDLLNSLYYSDAFQEMQCALQGIAAHDKSGKEARIS